MSYIGGKVLAGIVVGTLTVSAAAYTGGQYVDSIKSNITNLGKTVALAADESSQKIGIANKTIEAKNGEILRLEGLIDTLEGQLKQANDVITSGNAEVGKANVEVEKGNADMLAINTFAQDKATKFVKDVVTANVVDTRASVKGESPSITIVANADTPSTRSIRVTNPNGVELPVTVKSNVQAPREIIISAGDVVYVEKNNSGEMVSFSYTVPGTTEVVNTRPY